MTRSRQEQLVSLLARGGEWTTAATLADLLGVTPRSIRSYVAAINARLPQHDAVRSGPLGYRIDPDVLPVLRRVGTEAVTPDDRLHRLVRALLRPEHGVDVYDAADELHVSEATIASDLARVRVRLADTPLSLERSGSLVRLNGPEGAKRRLLSRLVHDEMDAGGIDIRELGRRIGADQIGSDELAAFKSALVDELGRLGYYVNEFGIADVLLHVTIAVDRIARQQALEPDEMDGATGAGAAIAEVITRLVAKHFGIDLGATDAAHLGALVQTRVVAPITAGADDQRSRLDPDVEHAVREAVLSAANEFLVDLAHEDFIARLALHVQNLQRRSRDGGWTRNPLTRSIKSSYPLIFEIAVFIASRLHATLGLNIQDDELAYIAMHVGGRLERNRHNDTIITATIVCPGYYELHELLHSSVNRSLGRDVEVVAVQTRADPDWQAIPTDLVLTTIAPPVSSDYTMLVQPFLTEADIERVRAAATRVRRARRLTRLRAELEQYFDAQAFVRGLDPADNEERVIRRLGALLVNSGVIGEDYVERTIEREHLSSTAFTDALAVPHALVMSASRTAIAVAVSEQSVAWGDSRVSVVALVAFSESDRAAFQTVFEQLVEVFSERESVQRIVRRGTDFTSFLDELVAVIDG